MSVYDNSFPLSQHKVNMTTGAIDGIVNCIVAGSITVTWEDDSTDVIPFAVGDSKNLTNTKSAVVTTGTFESF